MKSEEQKTIPVDGWLVEKVVASLVEVAGAARYAKEIENFGLQSKLSSNEAQQYEFVVEMLTQNLYAALYDLTKIAAKLEDSRQWNPEDRDTIYDNGQQGLADILVKYGMSSWLPYMGLRDFIPERRVDVQSVLLRVRELSQGLPGENRTSIYVELRPIARHPMARQIFDLIEPVTQGEKAWAEFQKEIAELLKEI